ncbi:MAG: hypothetical protein GY898_31305 [Proteobacteria bacterium]|nr:hypothetical protein [Pseudomonadota bacterium]
MRSTCPLLFSVVLLCACGSEPPEPDPIHPVSASYSCDEDPDPEWTFAISMSGPVDEGRTTVFVESEDVEDTDGFAMTVEGSNGDVVAFQAALPGTQDGQNAAPGAVPFACTAVADVSVIFCANPEGLPSERPCWACNPGTGEAPPPDIEDWIACD